MFLFPFEESLSEDPPVSRMNFPLPHVLLPPITPLNDPVLCFPPGLPMSFPFEDGFSQNVPSLRLHLHLFFAYLISLGSLCVLKRMPCAQV